MVAVPESKVTFNWPVLLTSIEVSPSVPKVTEPPLPDAVKLKIPVGSLAARTVGVDSEAGSSPMVMLCADTVAVLLAASVIAKVPLLTAILPIDTVAPCASALMAKPLVSKPSATSMVKEPSPVMFTAPLSPLM